jgi:hypothetical protein
MLDLDTTPKKQLISVVRQLQGLRGQPVATIAALGRVQNAKLQATVAELCGDEYVVGDDARAMRRPDPEPTPAPEPKPTRKRSPRKSNGHDETAVVAGVAVAERPAPVAPVPATGQSPVVPRDGVITVLHADNPKREGSASHARYGMLRSGMTVAEYLATAGSRGRRTLRKALRQGHIRVDGGAMRGAE